MTAKTLILSWFKTSRTSVEALAQVQLYVQTARLATMSSPSVVIIASELPKPLLSKNWVRPARPSK